MFAPNVEIVSGPSVAGVQAGDRIVFDPSAQVQVKTSSVKGPMARALHVRSGGEPTHRRFRFNVAERRFEVDTREATALTTWRPAYDLELFENPWRLRLHDNG